jgi:hypothetical protein
MSVPSLRIERLYESRLLRAAPARTAECPVEALSTLHKRHQSRGRSTGSDGFGVAGKAAPGSLAPLQLRRNQRDGLAFLVVADPAARLPPNSRRQPHDRCAPRRWRSQLHARPHSAAAKLTRPDCPLGLGRQCTAARIRFMTESHLPAGRANGWLCAVLVSAWLAELAVLGLPYVNLRSLPYSKAEAATSCSSRRSSGTTPDSNHRLCTGSPLRVGWLASRRSMSCTLRVHGSERSDVLSQTHNPANSR